MEASLPIAHGALPTPRRRHCIRRALQFDPGRVVAGLDGSAMLHFALAQGVTIVGKAAGQDSAPQCDDLPYLPWRVIAGSRNRPVHACFDADAAVPWSSMNYKLPEPAQRIEVALGAA